MNDHPEKDHPSEPKAYTQLVQMYLSRGLLVDDQERAVSPDHDEATGPDARGTP